MDVVIFMSNAVVYISAYPRGGGASFLDESNFPTPDCVFVRGRHFLCTGLARCRHK